jgi:hypothetical protein
VTDPAQEPDSWLRKVRWHHHLAGKGPDWFDRLRTLIRAVDKGGEEILAVIYTSFKRVIKAYCTHTRDKVVGESVLYTVNSMEYGKKAQDPFYMDIKDDTSEKY